MGLHASIPDCLRQRRMGGQQAQRLIRLAGNQIVQVAADRLDGARQRGDNPGRSVQPAVFQGTSQASSDSITSVTPSRPTMDRAP